MGSIMKECPRCGMKKLHPVEVRNALSRKDNETYICNDCGMEEALEDWEESKEWADKR